MFITNNTIPGCNSAISAFMSPFGSVAKQSLAKLRKWPHFESEGFLELGSSLLRSRGNS